MALTLEVLLSISFVDHFAMLIGPYADIGLGGSAKVDSDFGDSDDDLTVTSFGLTTSLAGYLP